MRSVSDGEVTYATLNRTSAERSFQTLRRELGISGFGMNLITLAAGERGRIHSHDVQEEVYLVLEGELTLMVEGQPRVMGVDALARVGPGVRRQLVNAGPGRLLLLALGGSGEHAGRDGHAWSSWEQTGPGAPPQEVPLPGDLPPN
jgi:mannose-6-phosphate isomerase-like protein (cupin superfamily)